jgi:hypothetical protein
MFRAPRTWSSCYKFEQQPNVLQHVQPQHWLSCLWQREKQAAFKPSDAQPMPAKQQVAAVFERPIQLVNFEGVHVIQLTSTLRPSNGQHAVSSHELPQHHCSGAECLNHKYPLLYQQQVLYNQKMVRTFPTTTVVVLEAINPDRIKDMVLLSANT